MIFTVNGYEIEIKAALEGQGYSDHATRALLLDLMCLADDARAFNHTLGFDSLSDEAGEYMKAFKKAMKG